ncbi:MAG: MEDS domain-containing protein [Candidatus Tectomicrobia bacterium]|uniref:histidine kinase n=1 Tax=Tectimicrobiota bacterium TaxID=2528274 RepID=A0A932CM22_UNCTE|nr:MEDS domain-containing protein [Candidatus Tectomicrobia bacterium]
MPAETWRNSGIEFLGDSPWGTHFCQFYSKPDDLIDILVPFLSTGIESNESCVWVTSESLSVEIATEAMRQAVPDIDRYLESGQMEIFPYTEWYMKDGYFDFNRVLDGWVAKHDRAVGLGYDGIRVTGDTAWLEKKDWKKFAEYENMIQQVVHNYQMLVLCTYSLDRCNANEIIDVVANHQFALIKREGQWELIESSERKRAAEEIQSLNEELKRYVIELETANRELDAFSYSVSHDLRAPLRSIDGFSLALLEDYADQLDAQGRDYLQRVRASSQRMAQLIDDLLNFSRITRSEMRHERVDLSALVQTIASELQKAQPERQVECVIAPGLVANGDERLLRLALENLLRNAWKFTGKHPWARIEFGVTQQEGQRAYFVRDDGAGFEMAYADKLFGAFQRLHAVAEFPGTGIGLAIVQRIIHRHGGRVWAEGAVEQGAAFYFTL